MNHHRELLEAMYLLGSISTMRYAILRLQDNGAEILRIGIVKGYIQQ